MEFLDWAVYVLSKVLFLVRLFLLFLSCCGYIQYLRKYVRTEFCYGLLFSGISCVLFFAGILNILPAAAWFLFLGGLYFMVSSPRKNERITDLICPGTVFFLLLAAFFAVVLYGAKFAHYDNFTHWAVASRILVEARRFPNFEDQNFLFIAYPLGSTCFIYYFSEITGIADEWIMMYAQAILMTGMLVSLFALSSGWIRSLMTAFFCVCLICCNNSICDLLVDTLLSITAVSAAAYCVYYGKDMKDRLWPLIFYAVFLFTIKNSGLLFIAVLYGYVWFTLRRESIPARSWLLLLAIPILTLILWKAHVRLVFPSGMSSPHSMTVSKFQSTFAELQSSDISQILKMIALKTFSPSNHALWILALGAVVYCIAKFMGASQDAERCGRVVLFAAICYLLYQVGIIGMYLFSMSRLEALRLAGYGRYHRTIEAFLAGLVFLGAIPLIPASRIPLRLKTTPPVYLILFCLVLSCFALSPEFKMLGRQRLDQYDTGRMRIRLEQLKKDYSIPEESDIMLITNPDNAYFMSFLAQYVLRPSELYVRTEDELALDGLSYIDYIIVFDESEKTKVFLSELSPGFSEPVYHLF